LENLLAIEEIDYFIFSNNDVVSNETLPNSIFVFDSERQARRDQKVLCEWSTLAKGGRRLLRSVSDVRKNIRIILYAIM